MVSLKIISLLLHSLAQALHLKGSVTSTPVGRPGSYVCTFGGHTKPYANLGTGHVNALQNVKDKGKALRSRGQEATHRGTQFKQTEDYIPGMWCVPVTLVPELRQGNHAGNPSTWKMSWEDKESKVK